MKKPRKKYKQVVFYHHMLRFKRSKQATFMLEVLLFSETLPESLRTRWCTLTTVSCSIILEILLIFFQIALNPSKIYLDRRPNIHSAVLYIFIWNSNEIYPFFFSSFRRKKEKWKIKKKQGKFAQGGGSILFWGK